MLLLVVDPARVLTPPVVLGEEPTALDMLRMAFTKAIDAMFDGGDLLHLVKTAPGGTAVVVAEAHQFRLATLTPLTSPQIEEDRWVAHSYRLAVGISALCETALSYVIVDFGTYAPSRQQNIDLLQSIPDTGF